MASPRWRKALADLKLSRSRTILVVLSIAIGVFAVGSLLTSRAVLLNGIDESFDLANPASAVIVTEPFDSGLVEEVRALPDVGDAEGRARVQAWLQKDPDTWLNLDLRAVGDFNDIRIDRLQPEDGAWPPATGELLIERLSQDVAGVAIGDQVTIEMPDGAQHALRVAGTVYDPGQVAPGLAEDRLNAYVTLETLSGLGQPAAFNELHVQAADDPRDLRQGEQVAAVARDQVLEPNDVVVHRIAVHDTPRYHSTALGEAMMLILGLLGGLTLLLGVFLVINTVNAIMTQQVRQIGVMKAIGGQPQQISGIYLALVLAYGLLAVIIAMPLAVLAAWALTGFGAEMLNINASGPWLPPSVVALELALGLLVPLLAALVPVLRGTRITVREAITSYGLSGDTSPDGFLNRLIERLRGISRPVRLALRNTFRRRGRLALTLTTLMLGGAIFASVTTIRSSLDGTLDDIRQYTSYDVQVTLDDAVAADAAIGEASSLPGIVTAEGWIATNASFIRTDGTQNSNVWLTAAPAESDLIRPTLVEGRWFEPGEGQGLVINVDFRVDEPDISLGDLVTLKAEGHELRWPVIGIVTSQLVGPAAYVPYESFSQAVDMNGEVNCIVLVTDDHGVDAQAAVAAQAEEALRAGGLPVAQVDTITDLRAGTEGLFDLLVLLLLIVGTLLVAVGALGLTGAMSLNVIERTREIGVMRAIGASNGTVARIVITEGLVVGLLSWLIGALLAIPLSWALSYAVGVTFLQSPLSYVFSIAGVVFWLLLVIVLSVLASLLPARRAWRLSVRDALAYE